MQRPQDTGLYQELHGIGSFSISDHSPNRAGRSPSHSPAISPRIMPQQMAQDVSQHNQFALGSNGFVTAPNYGMQAQEAFPQLQVQGDMSQQMPQIAAPTISINYAPPDAKSGFEGRPSLDTDALTPPERGKQSLPWPSISIPC